MEHLVFLKYDNKAQGEELCKAVVMLKKIVPQIKEVSCGETFTDRGKGFTHALRVRLDSKEDLDKYRSHPAHVSVVNEFIKGKAADSLAMDYEDKPHKMH